MSKRLYSFKESCPLQLKMHIGVKELVSDTYENTKVYVKTKELLFSGAVKRLDSSCVKRIIQTPSIDNCDQLQGQRILNLQGQIDGLYKGENVSMCTNIQSMACYLCKQNIFQVCQSRCSFCEKLVCSYCIQICYKCQGNFCQLCSMLRYDEREEQSICLSCNQ